MKSVKHFKLYCAFLAVLLLFEGCAFSERSSTAQQINQAATPASNKQPDIEVLRDLPDPCLYGAVDFDWDREKKDANFRLYDFMNAGFPKEILLEEAVAVFNKLAQCDERGKNQPPLTTGEVLAAIRDWDCTEEKDAEDKKFCADVWKTAETGVMPKGSFIDLDCGMSRMCRVRGYKGHNVKTWEIELYFYLDRHRRDLRDVPEFTRTIRLKYTSSEPKETPR